MSQHDECVTRDTYNAVVADLAHVAAQRDKLVLRIEKLGNVLQAAQRVVRANEHAMLGAYHAAFTAAMSELRGAIAAATTNHKDGDEIPL
jgi:predicted ATP-dependent protease